MKEQPTRADIQNINDACGKLLSSKSTGSPCNDPFRYLGVVDCILYAVVAAFLLNKGWKRKRAGNKRMAEKDKDVLKEQVKEIRRKLSIAKAELDRVKKNGRIIRKGRRNRKLLLQECKVISINELVNLIEKKSRIRKLKRAYAREKKNEEARKINKMFQRAPRRLYSILRKWRGSRRIKTEVRRKARDPKRGRSFRECRTSSELLEDTGRARGLGISRQSGWKRSDSQWQAVYQRHIGGSVVLNVTKLKK